MSRGVFEVQIVDRESSEERWLKVQALSLEDAARQVAELGGVVGKVRLVEVLTDPTRPRGLPDDSKASLFESGRRPSRAYSAKDFQVPFSSFFVWTLISMCAYVVVKLSEILTHKETPAIVLILGLTAWIVGIVFWCIFLYRVWDQAQTYSQRTTPGMAVGFGFVPFFTAYWRFVALLGLVDDSNRFAIEHKLGAAVRVNRELVLTVCILGVVLWVGILAALFGDAGLAGGLTVLDVASLAETTCGLFFAAQLNKTAQAICGILPSQ